MDAVQYLITAKMMCSFNKRCMGCPLDGFCNGNYEHIENPEKMVARVQEWAEEHPVKTRKSELLKVFPNISDNNGDIVLCPKVVDQNYGCRSGETTCAKCMDEYWLAEVEEDDDDHM